MTDYLAFPPVRGVRGDAARPAVQERDEPGARRSRRCRPSRSRSSGRSTSDDTRASARAVCAAMGATIARLPRRARGPGPARAARPAREVLLDAGDSGTAARFLAAVGRGRPGALLADRLCRVCGSGRWRSSSRRSDRAGARIEYVGRRRFLPLRIEGGTLRSGRRRRRRVAVEPVRLGAPARGVAVEGGLSVRAGGTSRRRRTSRRRSRRFASSGHEVRGGRTRSGSGEAPASRPDTKSRATTPRPCRFSRRSAVGGRLSSCTGLRWPSRGRRRRRAAGSRSDGIVIARERDGRSARGSRAGPERRSRPRDGFPGRRARALAALAALADGREPLRRNRPPALQGERPHRGAGGAPDVGRRRGPSRRRDALVVSGPATPTAERAGAAADAPAIHRMAMAARAPRPRAAGRSSIENPGCVAKSYPGFFRRPRAALRRRPERRPTSRQ